LIKRLVLTSFDDEFRLESEDDEEFKLVFVDEHLSMSIDDVDG